MSRPRDPWGWEAWAWEEIERAGDSLSGVAGLVLLQLAKHGNRDGQAYPSSRTLAGYLGRTDKPVRRAFAQLVDRGLILPLGEGTQRKATIWQFVADLGRGPESADPASADHADSASADPVSAGADPVSADHAGDCGPSADHLRTRGPLKVEVEEPTDPPVAHEGAHAHEGARTSAAGELKPAGGAIADLAARLQP